MLTNTPLTSRTVVLAGGEHRPCSIIEIFTIFVIQITTKVLTIQLQLTSRAVHRSLTVPLVFISKMAGFIENNSNRLEIKELLPVK